MSQNSDYNYEKLPKEPVPGLPQALPEDEKILWQGKPGVLATMFGALRLRWIIGWFVIATAARFANLSATSAEQSQMNEALFGSLAFGIVALLVIWLLALAMSRPAIFTITNKRVVLRYGFAVRKYINAPFSQLASAELKQRHANLGDIALQMEDGVRIGYLHLWPFARPFKYLKPQPMLRGIREPEMVAKILADAVKAHSPGRISVQTTEEKPRETVSDPAMPVATA
ncbi:MAG: photosynthetic complex putative assembly protein PuhB [Pseudomonadota bacterium]